VTSEDGFDAFYLGAYRRVVRELYAVLGSFDEAEDLAQEAFARASVRWSRIRDYDQPDAWVRRVALNLAFSSLRRARRAALATVRLRQPEAAAAPSPDELADGLALGQALGRLRLRDREVLALRYLADLGVDEIAGVLGLPATTVKGRLGRARDALERELRLADGEEARHA
jgi:RNA polymerase sigma-70 factor (ECF subfamily)